MLRIVDDQHQADDAFEAWLDAIRDGSTVIGGGFQTGDRGVVFQIEGDKVHFGDDAIFQNFVVTIVRPDVQRTDRAKLTVAADDQQGNRYLLREGWLKRNHLSETVRADFSKDSGLKPIPVVLRDGSLSARDWYIVAAVGSEPSMIRKQTVDFALACAQARMVVSVDNGDDSRDSAPSFGKDEMGRVYRVTRTAGDADVTALQGYVWKALQTIFDKRLAKNKNTGYCADGVIKDISVLLEIKTGTSARDVYEGVGQLMLYPSVLKLDPDIKPLLLTPDLPPISAALAEALKLRDIEHFTYSLGILGQEPSVKFSDTFLKRCEPCPVE